MAIEPRIPTDEAGSSKFGDGAWVLSDTYSDAARLFSHEQLTSEECIKSAVVVLDTNVLILPWERKQKLQEIAAIYGKLAREKRLMIPGQVAREFYSVRDRKIVDIKAELSTAISSASPAIPYHKLENLLHDPSILAEAKSLSETLIESQKALISSLKTIQTELESFGEGQDAVSKMYRETFADCVVDPDWTPDQKVAISEERDRRKALNIPPSYKDNRPGDFIIWKTILFDAAQRKGHCIFVTADDKSDWVIRSQGKGRAPRSELVHEYAVASAGGSFLICGLAELLRLEGASPAVVDEVGAEELRLNAIFEIEAAKSQLQAQIQVIDRDLEQQESWRNILLHSHGPRGRSSNQSEEAFQLANAEINERLSRDRQTAELRLIELRSTRGSLMTELMSLINQEGGI